MNHGDIAILGTLVLTFALLVTAHVTIVLGLLRRAPRWRSVVALVVAPLAPYWAIRGKMYVRAAAWLLGAVGYVIARRLAA
jgi:hypothetical protein